MPRKPRSVYWDANVFLHYIEATPEHITVLDELLRQASAGDVTILTSTLSIAEVAFARHEQTRRRLDPAIEAKINKLWADRSAVTLIEVSQPIAFDAQAMSRWAAARGWGLKGADAIHLASAHRFGAEEFQTYERGKLDRFSSYVGCPVGEPSIPQPPLPFPDG